jgi:transcriptional regulator with XRE-family HTH domain
MRRPRNTQIAGPAIGRRLHRARTSAGLTQQDLASRAGVEQVTISRYEGGRVESPTVPNVVRLADALGVSIEWLTTGRGSQRAAA